MNATSKQRGHDIEFINNQWIYSDTKKPIVTVGVLYKERECGNCGKEQTKEGHDACLGTLPGLMNACCGHGVKDEAYVQFLDGYGIHGKDAVTIIEILKKLKSA